MFFEKIVIGESDHIFLAISNHDNIYQYLVEIIQFKIVTGEEF